MTVLKKLKDPTSGYSAKRKVFDAAQRCYLHLTLLSIWDRQHDNEGV